MHQFRNESELEATMLRDDESNGKRMEQGSGLLHRSPGWSQSGGA